MIFDPVSLQPGTATFKSITNLAVTPANHCPSTDGRADTVIKLHVNVQHIHARTKSSQSQRSTAFACTPAGAWFSAAGPLGTCCFIIRFISFSKADIKWPVHFFGSLWDESLNAVSSCFELECLGVSAFSFCLCEFCLLLHGPIIPGSMVVRKVHSSVMA